MEFRKPFHCNLGCVLLLELLRFVGSLRLIVGLKSIWMPLWQGIRQDVEAFTETPRVALCLSIFCVLLLGPTPFLAELRATIHVITVAFEKGLLSLWNEIDSSYVVQPLHTSSMDYSNRMVGLYSSYALFCSILIILELWIACEGSPRCQ